MHKIKDAIIKTFNFFKRNKSLTTLILTILVLNALIVASAAWLSINRNTYSNEMGMGLAVDDSSAKYKAYMYDLESSKGTDIGQDEQTLDITNLDLNQYDTIFRSQNRYTPAFARIEILSNQSMPKDGTVHITIERLPESALDGEDEAFSSQILRFTAFVIPDNSDLQYTTPNELYNFINTIDRYNIVTGYSGNDREFSKTFVNVIGEGAGHTHERESSITISVDYTADCWYKNANGNDTLNVYLYITYDVDLIECYMNEHTSGEISLDDNSVFFENDLKKVTVSYSE